MVPLNLIGPLVTFKSQGASAGKSAVRSTPEATGPAYSHLLRFKSLVDTWLVLQLHSAQNQQNVPIPTVRQTAQISSQLSKQANYNKYTQQLLTVEYWPKDA